jgi:hypothetical protein
MRLLFDEKAAIGVVKVLAFRLNVACALFTVCLRTWHIEVWFILRFKAGGNTILFLLFQLVRIPKLVY